MDISGDPNLSVEALNARLDRPNLTSEDREILSDQWAASMIHTGVMHIVETVLTMREHPGVAEAVIRNAAGLHLDETETHRRIEQALGLGPGHGRTAANALREGIVERRLDGQGHDMVMDILERLGVDAGERRRTLTLASDLICGTTHVPDDLSALGPPDSGDVRDDPWAA